MEMTAIIIIIIIIIHLKDKDWWISIKLEKTISLLDAEELWDSQ